MRPKPKELPPALKCLDAETGKLINSVPCGGQASVIMAGDMVTGNEVLNVFVVEDAQQFFEVGIRGHRAP